MSDQSVSLPKVKLAVPNPTAAQPHAATASPNMDARIPSQQVNSSKNSKSGSDKKSIDRSLLEQQLKEVNREYVERNISIRFSIDDATDSLVIKVMDTNTDKVIRQIPPDELLAIRKQVQEMLGEIFDTQA
jgi:flagellar protein FlaG